MIAEYIIEGVNDLIQKMKDMHGNFKVSFDGECKLILSYKAEGAWRTDVTMAIIETIAHAVYLRNFLNIDSTFSSESSTYYIDLNQIKDEIILDKLIKTILNFTNLYNGDEDEEIVDLECHIDELVDELMDNFELIAEYSPTAADYYMINYIYSVGEFDYEEKDDKLEDVLKGYYFYQSYEAREQGYCLYVSTYAWLVPPNQNLESILQTIAGINADKLYKVKEEISDNLYTLFYSDKGYGVFSNYDVKNAEKAVSSAIRAGNTPERWLTHNNTVLISRVSNWYVIVFEDNDWYNRDEKIKLIQDYLKEQLEKSLHIFPNNLDIILPWEKLDDEDFELLIYDLLYKYANIEINSLRKLGTSRDSDGGRDLVAVEISNPGSIKKNWIFQCKFTKKCATVGTGKVQDITDTIFRHNADCYGLITNGTVSSALHDKLNSIEKNYKKKIFYWSKIELERMLNNSPELVLRYFSSKE